MITPEILESWIADLAKSKGFYCRMLRDWRNLTDESKEEYCQYLNDKGIKDSLGFVLEVEQ